MATALKQYGRTWFRIHALILVLFSVACTRIPLLNYLGFEFSAFTALVAGLLSGLALLSYWKQDRPASKMELLRFTAVSFATQFIIALVPLLILLANAFFVRNCSISGGILLYILIVFPAVFFSLSVSTAIGAFFKKWHKTLFVIIYFLLLLHIPLVTYFRPQIFAFNPVIGFFPGFTYDESLRVVQRLVIYRCSTLAASVSILALVFWVWHVRFAGKRLDGSHYPPLAEIIVFALLCPAVFIVFLFSDRLGFSSSESYIRQKLAGSHITAHFDIVYPVSEINSEKIKQLGLLHEFYFRKITGELNVCPERRIVSFIYASSEQKGRLIGANRTDISKPWLGQMHINYPDVENVLGHEMVHVLAAKFGWSPLKIAPNSGLVEGLAVAMERTAYEETLERAAALAIAAGSSPDIVPLFGASFFKTNASTGYTLAGSFCRFMIDTSGIEKFKSWYGGGDFKKIYGMDIGAMAAAWKRSVSKVRLTQVDTLKGMYFFRRRTIFEKECARVLANLNENTRELLRRREFEKALSSARKSLNLGRTTEAISQETSVLFELHLFKDAAVLINGYLADKNTAFSLLPLYLRLGDACWALDSAATAGKIYEKLAAFHLSSWYEEACAVRIASLHSRMYSSELRNYFIYSLEDTTRILRLKMVNDPVANYLLAREYAAKGMYDKSITLLQNPDMPLPAGMDYFRFDRLARSWMGLKEYAKAKYFFAKSMTAAPTEYLRYRAETMTEQCDFYAGAEK